MIKNIRLLIWICIPVVLKAGHPLVSDDVGTVGEHHWQLELTPAVFLSSHERDIQIPLIATYGLFDGTDLVLTTNYCHYYCSHSSSHETIDGWHDGTLELKWRFMERDQWGFALKPGVYFPLSGKTELSSPGGGMLLLQTLNLVRTTLLANFGFYYLPIPRARNWLWSISFAASFSLSERIQYVVDLVANRNSEINSSNHPFFLINGIQFQVNDFLVLDYGLQTGLNNLERDFVSLFGITLWR